MSAMPYYKYSAELSAEISAEISGEFLVGISAEIVKILYT